MKLVHYDYNLLIVSLQYDYYICLHKDNTVEESKENYIRKTEVEKKYKPRV